MLSRKEEERNEKIIRGLLKLPPNRRCINCNSLGPQYACTNFWTFICTTCSGIHREFTHRVKSVSMAKFTTQEVQSLERGGNQRAKEYFLKEWDMQNTRLPSSSNPDRIREFIKAVYVEKKFARGISSDKPPRVTQNHKNFDEDRKASSYHSYSQSPPYDNQYEDRRYGKSSGIQTRRTGSERLSYDGKLHSAEYYDDRFSNDGSGPRNSDFSVSSTGDMTKYDVQSPNFHKGTEYMSPPMQPVRDILLEDKNVTMDVNKNPHPQRTVSSSSFGSIHSVEVMPFSSTSLFDVGIDSETPSGTQIIDVATPSSSLPQSSVQSPAPENDLFGLLSGDQSTNSASQLIDLFAEINQIPPSNQNTVQVPFLENTGWATFDTTQPSVSIVEPKSTLHNVSHVDGKPDGNLGAYSTETNISNWVPVKSSNVSENVNSITDQWNITSNQTNAVAPSSSEFWNAFDFSTGMSSQTSRNPALNTSSLVPYVERQDLFDGLELPEDSGRYGFHGMASGVGTSTQSISFGDTVVPKIPSVSPAMEVKTHERKSLNPFDFPCEPDLGHGNSFGMGSLHDALPNPQFQNNILQNLFIDDPATSFISPVPSGGFSYMTAQQSNPQLTTLSSPSQVGSPGGNPFA